MELACSDFTFIHDNINGGLPSDPLPRVSLGSGGVGEDEGRRRSESPGWMMGGRFFF